MFPVEQSSQNARSTPDWIPGQASLVLREQQSFLSLSPQTTRPRSGWSPGTVEVTGQEKRMTLVFQSGSFCVLGHSLLAAHGLNTQRSREKANTSLSDMSAPIGVSSQRCREAHQLRKKGRCRMDFPGNSRSTKASLRCRSNEPVTWLVHAFEPHQRLLQRAKICAGDSKSKFFQTML